MNKFSFLLNARSVGKALRDVGLALLGAAIPAALAAFADPQTFVALLEALGPFAIVAAPVLAWLAKYLQDAWAHRPQ